MKKEFGQSVRLSPVEHQILQAAAAGLTTKEIAQEIFLAPKTVEHFLSRQDRGLYHKLGVKNRAQATAWYSETRTAHEILTHHGYDTLEKIRQTRLNGQAILARVWAAGLSDRLRAEIEARFWISNQLDDLRYLLAQLLREQLVACYESTLPLDIWRTIGDITGQLRALAGVSDDKTLSGLVSYAEGTAYYIEKQYDQSIKACDGALKTIENVDQRLAILRIQALNWAYLGEKQRFNDIATEAMNLIDEGHISEPALICLALEGVGRGQGLLKITTAFDTLAKGWEIHNRIKSNINRIPLRFIQLVRSELEAMRHLHMPDKQILEDQAKQALRLATKLDYPRYARQLEHHLAWPGFN